MRPLPFTTNNRMLKKIAMKSAVGIMRLAYVPFRMLKQRNRITFISRQSDSPSYDMTATRVYLEKHYPETECFILARKLEGTNLLAYCLHMLTQMKYMATSRVIVLDGYCVTASVLRHKKGTEIVQMWHALAAIKKFGYQTIGMPLGRKRETAEIMHMHANYDYVISPSMATGKVFCKGFNTDESKITLCGLPRIDRLLSEETGSFETESGKRKVLYVPTFRKGSKVDAGKLAKALDPEKNILIIKAHPLYEDDVILGEQGKTDLEIIIDKEHDSYWWLKNCDCIITDYSALGVEAALLNKPLYYYVYDIDRYEKEIGLNLNPLKELPGASSEKAETIAELVEKEYDFEALRKFREKYISIDTENCTAQFSELLVEIMRKTINEHTEKTY